MDATLASLESKATQAKADAGAKADSLVADMKKRRDEFQAELKAAMQGGEAALQTAKAQLELQWSAFETQLQSYFESVGKQIDQQQATFRNIAAAQLKAWRDAANELQAEAAKAAAARRVGVEAAIQHMKQDAAQAEARLQKLERAGNESWTALSGALADSRRAFDRASQQVWDAFTRTTSPT
jgi:hypothetical protein